MKKIIFIIAFFAAPLLSASCKTATSTSTPVEQPVVVSTSPLPGSKSNVTVVEVKDPDALLDNFNEYELKAFEKMQFFSEDEIKKFKPQCMVLKNFNSEAFFDPAGDYWNGTSYDAALIPVIAKEGEFKTKDGRTVYLLKALSRADANSISKDRNPRDKEFIALYWLAEDLTTDWKQTDWSQDGSPYDAKDPTGLCTLSKVMPVKRK